MALFDVIVVGAGATGIFTALDLSLRGLRVLVIEKGGIASGTSGRYHGLIHSGARYVVADPISAKDCSKENETLAVIAPFSIIHRGGYHVCLKDDEDTYLDQFKDGMERLGIWHQEVSEIDEPLVNPSMTCAFKVRDLVADPFKLLGAAALLAKESGTKFLFHSEVMEMDEDEGKIRLNSGSEFHSKIIVNATGPWASRYVRKPIPLMPTLGVMLVYHKKVVKNVINRLRFPSDGDLLLPFYDAAILGTNARPVENPDNKQVEPKEISALVEEGSKLVPSLKEMAFDRYYSSVRPLLKGENGRKGSRDFEIHETGKLITPMGGKLTTSRLIGERVADRVCDYLHLDKVSVTSKTLLPNPFDENKTFSGTVADERYSLGVSLAHLENFLQG